MNDHHRLIESKSNEFIEWWIGRFDVIFGRNWFLLFTIRKWWWIVSMNNPSDRSLWCFISQTRRDEKMEINCFHRNLYPIQTQRHSYFVERIERSLVSHLDMEITKTKNQRLALNQIYISNLNFKISAKSGLSGMCACSTFTIWFKSSSFARASAYIRRRK